MTAAKITCPECQSVLKTSKPVPPGKKVTCPKCGSGFTTPGASAAAGPKKAARSEAKADPRKKAITKKPAKSSTPPRAAAKKVMDDEDDGGGGTYGVVQESAEEIEDQQQKVNYAPDLSIKDLRGPAQGAVVRPSNYLMVAGSIGFLGYLGFLVVILIPILFPLEVEKKEEVPPGMAANNDKEKDKEKEKKKETSFFNLAGYNLRDLADEPWYLVVGAFLGIAAGMGYCSLLTFGAVKMQNLESRAWSIAGGVLAIIPPSVMGLNLLSAVLLQFFLGMVFDEQDTINMMLLGFSGLEWLLWIAVGMTVIITANSEDVKAGFEYKPD